jgi:hypothetical protein
VGRGVVSDIASHEPEGGEPTRKKLCKPRRILPEHIAGHVESWNVDSRQNSQSTFFISIIQIRNQKCKLGDDIGTRKLIQI